MPAGLNVMFDVWEMNYEPDDYVGGASISGSLIYSNVFGSIQQIPTSTVFLEQGIETNKVFQILLVPATLQIHERDELELVLPNDHYFVHTRFRIVGVQPARNVPRDPRNYLIIQAHRKVEAHRQQ